MLYYYFLNKKLTTITMMKGNYANPFRLIWCYEGVYVALSSLSTSWFITPNSIVEELELSQHPVILGLTFH